jgi:hypothetical protein
MLKGRDFRDSPLEAILISALAFNRGTRDYLVSGFVIRISNVPRTSSTMAINARNRIVINALSSRMSIR